jgi:predicted Zn-dependent peptidase
VVVEDEKATLPLIYTAYEIPQHDDADTRALSLLGRILGGGESSRLNQRLVKQERAALQAFGGASSGIGPGTLVAAALANQGVEPDRIESLIWEELQKIVEEGVTERELQKAKNQTRASTIMGRQRVAAKAGDLQHYRYFHGDIAEINRDLDKTMAVTTADIMRVARKYIDPANRTIVVAVPAGQSN